MTLRPVRPVRPVRSAHAPQKVMDRRRFLSLFGASAAAGATALACGTKLPGAPMTDTTAAPPASRTVPGGRTLVVIELQGGNDGLSMLTPYNDGLLRDVRGPLMSSADELVGADDEFGWHPALAGIVGAGAAGVVGIGSDQPSFSHFEMENRWWRGDSRPNADWTSGVFGRMCDQLDVGDPVTGLSLAGGPSASLTSEKAVTVGLVHPDANWFLQEDAAWFGALRSAQRTMASDAPVAGDRTASPTPSMAAAKGGLTKAMKFAESLSQASVEGDNTYPWTDLGQQLRFAAEVLALGVGIRVLHVRQGGFDTHAEQGWRYRELMTEFNDATVAFVEDLTQRGLWGDTLIMTTSEFGRRIPINDGGTDHGAASCAMLIGDGLGGVHGASPNLSLADEGNLVATARFEDYYATVAEGWFGLDLADLLPKGSDSIFELR